MNTKRQRELKDQISDRISCILEEKGWIQQDLADRLVLNKSYVSNILRGTQNLTIDTIANLEMALGEKIIMVETGKSSKKGKHDRA